MSEEQNEESRYVKYCKEWFGIDIDPKEQFVTVEQWKMYRLTISHDNYRKSYYFFLFVLLCFMFLYLWGVIV